LNRLNSQLASGWAHYLPQDALHTLRYAGYYTARVRPGLRVISLNSNYYASGNFWLVSNNTDYSSQLPWMKNVLKQARQLKEKVIIIGHGVSSGWVAKFSKFLLVCSFMCPSSFIKACGDITGCMV
jgi:hypothetical protein